MRKHLILQILLASCACCAAGKSDFWQEKHSLPKHDKHNLLMQSAAGNLRFPPVVGRYNVLCPGRHLAHLINLPALWRARPRIIDLKGRHIQCLVQLRACRGPTAERVPKAPAIWQSEGGRRHELAWEDMVARQSCSSPKAGQVGQTRGGGCSGRLIIHSSGTPHVSSPGSPR